MTRALILIAALAGAAACNDAVTGLGPPSDPSKETFAASLGVNIADMTRTSSGVYYKDLVVGPDTAALISDKTTSVNATYWDTTVGPSAISMAASRFRASPRSSSTSRSSRSRTLQRRADALPVHRSALETGRRADRPREHHAVPR